MKARCGLCVKLWQQSPSTARQVLALALKAQAQRQVLKTKICNSKANSQHFIGHAHVLIDAGGHLELRIAHLEARWPVRAHNYSNTSREAMLPLRLVAVVERATVLEN